MISKERIEQIRRMAPLFESLADELTETREEAIDAGAKAFEHAHELDTQNMTIADLRETVRDLLKDNAKKDAKIARYEYLLSSIGHAIGSDTNVQDGLAKLGAANSRNVEGPLAQLEAN